MLTDVGFVDGELHNWTGYRTSSCTQGALVSAKKSALVTEKSYALEGRSS
jgi:hypothetical protein